MKKVISLVLVALLMGTVAYAAQPLKSPGIGDIMGQGDFASDPHRIFRLVRYIPQSTKETFVEATLTADSIVIWDKVSDDGVTITTSTTSYDSSVAGIAVVDILTPEANTQGNTAVQDIGKRNWGWLQTYGKSEVTIQGDCGTATVGDALAVGDESGKACDFLASTSVSTAQGNAGFFYDTGAAAATNVEVFLVCD